MGFCPYCKQIVGDNVTECPSCGMSWAGQGQPQPQYPQQQPAQQQYQQPPAQPQYQQAPAQQYPQQYPPQQQYQQPPPQQYSQQPPPQQYQPQPQYQQGYGQPYPPQQPAPRRVVGAGSMMAALIGGVGALVASYMFFLVVTMNDIEYIPLWDYLEYAPEEFLYAWMIPVAGVMAILFGIIGFAAQSRGMGYLVGILGILLLILPVIFAFHVSVEADIPIQEVFYSSAETTIDERSFSMFLGGFEAMLAGLIVMAGGFGLAGRIGREQRRHPPQQQYR